MVCYSTQKLSKWGVCTLRGSFDLENGWDWLVDPTGCIHKVLTDVHNFFGIFDVGFWITQIMVCYSTRNSFKWGVCTLRGFFWLLKWLGLAVSDNRMHNQGLSGRPQNIMAFFMSEFRPPKKWFAIAYENHLNKGYVRFRCRLTIKMGRTGRKGQPDA